MDVFPKIELLGERGILIQFEAEINGELLERLLALKKMLQIEFIKEKVEVINTYNSLLINYVSPIEDAYNEVLRVQKLIGKPNLENNSEKQLFHIPVCYDPQFGLDLDEVSHTKNISVEEIVGLHSNTIYTVYFIGFLPGFLYLGGLNKRLEISRKDQPRLEVKKGAVGIGEKQTGIYPQSSPGGWQIIGNSPVPLFDKNKVPPSEISAGSRIKFYPVSLQEHEGILEAVKAGAFSFKKETYGGN